MSGANQNKMTTSVEVISIFVIKLASPINGGCRQKYLDAVREDQDNGDR